VVLFPSVDTDKTLASGLDRPTYWLMRVIAAEVPAAKNVPTGAIGAGIEAASGRNSRSKLS
jgi:hypothetical protein